MSRPALVWVKVADGFEASTDDGLYAVAYTGEPRRYKAAEYTPIGYRVFGQHETLGAAKAACERHWQESDHG